MCSIILLDAFSQWQLEHVVHIFHALGCLLVDEIFKRRRKHRELPQVDSVGTHELLNTAEKVSRHPSFQGTCWHLDLVTRRLQTIYGPTVLLHEQTMQSVPCS